MSWPQQRAPIVVHSQFGPANEQGQWVATGEIGDHKSALSNGVQAFVRDLRPPAGSYVLFAPTQPYPPQGKGESIRFTVKYPVAVLNVNGREEIVGGDFRWSSYMVGSDPKWTEVGTGLVLPTEEA